MAYNAMAAYYEKKQRLMKSEVLIVLGGTNSPTGQLSDISITRLNYCISNFKKGNRILCTGGWGELFNKATSAHATYAKQYLIKNGLLEESFLDLALSSNTVEDAVKVKSIIAKLKNSKLTVITSDFHLNRVKLIFNEILKNHKITYVGVASNLDLEKYNKLLLHEENAINSILQNGLYY